MKVHFGFLATVRAAALRMRSRSRSESAWGEVGSTSVPLGDLGQETRQEREDFNRLALHAPRNSHVLARHAAEQFARKVALLADLAENDVTFKSFQDFKAWRAELAEVPEP